MKKILIISFSQIHSDPRVMRQINLLQPLYEIYVVGFGKKPNIDIQYLELFQSEHFFSKLMRAFMRLVGLFETQFWMQSYVKKALKTLQNNNFDLVLANDVSSLPLALKVNKRAPVICDAHEYSPREFDQSLLWRLHYGRYAHYLCNQYLKQCNAMFTVCEGIAAEYYKQYGVEPKVMHSAPAYQGLIPLKISKDQIKLIHHGATIRARHLETMIDMMRFLDDRFTLDFMLMETDPTYLLELKSLAATIPRIRFITPVSMENICTFINQYDIGIYLLQPVNFNHRHALPNKFFEFIQASLAIAIGPSPEMANLLNRYKLGIISSSFNPNELAHALNQLSSEEVMNYKKASYEAAKTLNALNEGKSLISAIDSLIKVH